MNKIKTIKIKNEDGLISEDSYLIAADAVNVDMVNGKNVQETIGTIDIDQNGDIATQLNKKIYYFNTAAEMKATNLKENNVCQTLGYYSVDDGGAGLYKIVNDNTLVDDGGSIQTLNNGLKAVLISKENYEVIGNSNQLKLTDKYLFLFGKDKNYWKIVGERSNSYQYKVGDCIKDKNSNKVYKCTTAGTTSSTYPDFNSSTITDGTITWTLIQTDVNDWEMNTTYSIDDCVSIVDLFYVCIKQHTSSKENEYSLKLINGNYYKRNNSKILSNYPEIFLTIGYDNVNKVDFEGKLTCTSAIQLSNDGKTFNIIDTPMNFNGQDFSPLFHNGKFYILTPDKQRYNDFGMFITQNFKDYVKAEIDLDIATASAEHVWFPQWFEDTINNKLYMLVTIQDKNTPVVTYNNRTYLNFRLFKIEVTDLENLEFGEITPINLSDNSRFDACIQIKDNTYYLFTRRYVDQNDNSHEGFVEIWTSTDLENWTLQTSRISALNDSGYEAMSVVAVSDNKYYLYVSRNVDYDYQRVYRIESSDLINWSNKIALPPTTLNLNEFGTVIKVTNQEALSYLYNYMTTNNNSRNIIRPTNYLNLESTKTLIWRNLNYGTHTLNLLSAEDVIYVSNVNSTDIQIDTITSRNEIPHRFFIRTTNVGTDYIKITSSGNIFLPNEITEIYLYADMLAEFIYDSSINKYILVNPTLDFIRKSKARTINLNDLAENNIIDNLQIEPNCIYQVNLNTQLTINKFSFKFNYNGEFKIYFLLYGSGSNNNTSLTLKNASNNAVVTQYGTSSDYVLNSTNNSNKYICFERPFGTGQLHLSGI